MAPAAKRSRPPKMGATVEPADWPSVDAYVSVPGSGLELGASGCAFQLTEQNVNAVTAKVRATLDGVKWYDVKTIDELGATRASVDIAIAKNGTAFAVVNGTLLAGSQLAFRRCEVQVKSTVSATPGSLRVRGLAK